MTDTFVIDVCVCTFRRPSVEQTLKSIAAQRLSAHRAIRLIVADNDDQPSAQSLIEKTCAALGLNHVYIHAPSRNISIARNACLEMAEAPLIAFIDDDEEAVPDWLQRLADDLETKALDVAFGPVRALYGSELKPWLRQADLHSTQPAIRASGEIDTGYTCNVLFRRAVIGARRFDPALGRSGGEDTVFFAALAAHGAKLGFCPQAEVTERVTPQRASLGWLLRRSFRSGQSHGRTLANRGGRLSQAALASTKAIFCLMTATAKLASPVGWRSAAVRGALHLGVVTRLLGSKDLELY